MGYVPGPFYCPTAVINVIGGGRPDAYGTPQIVRWPGESDADWRDRCGAFFRKLGQDRADYERERAAK